MCCDANPTMFVFDRVEIGQMWPVQRAVNRMIFGRMGESPEPQKRIAEMIDRRRTPDEILETPRILGWTPKTLLRGQFGVIAPFLASGKRLREERAEIARRMAVYQAARPKFEPGTNAVSYTQAAERA